MAAAATFKLGEKTFTEGDTLVITTPEFGTVEVHAYPNGISRGLILGLDMGYIKTPLACESSMRKGVNARLTLYSNGEGYVNLMMNYCCTCPYELHNHALEWNDLAIEGNVIKANSIGGYYRMKHNHPLAEGYEYLQPKPVTPLSAPALPRPAPVAAPPVPKPAAPEPAKAKKAEFIPSEKINHKTGQIGLF